MDEKKCPGCQRILPLDSFGLSRARKDGRQNSCKECMKAYRLAHYYKNKEPYLARSQKQKKEAAEFLQELKAKTPCADCEKRYPYYVMDFDHLEGSEKSGNIAHLTDRGMKKLLLEISKCEIVCSNCHRERTWQRLQK